MDIDYSSPTRERGISYETLADGMLHIDIRPAGLPGITKFNSKAVLAFLGICLALPVVVIWVVWWHNRDPLALAMAVLSLFVATFLGGIISVLTIATATRRYFVVASRDALDIEQTGQFQDREHHRWTRERIQSVTVEKVSWGDERRWALCVYRSGEMKSFMADRPESEVREVATAINAAMGIV